MKVVCNCFIFVNGLIIIMCSFAEDVETYFGSYDEIKHLCEGLNSEDDIKPENFDKFMMMAIIGFFNTTYVDESMYLKYVGYCKCIICRQYVDENYSFCANCIF